MTSHKDKCAHVNLTLLPRTENRLRCRHCHLTIKTSDVQDGYCPECYERSGQKHDDFETVAADKGSASTYRCEACGAIVETGGQ